MSWNINEDTASSSSRKNYDIITDLLRQFFSLDYGLSFERYFMYLRVYIRGIDVVVDCAE